MHKKTKAKRVEPELNQAGRDFERLFVSEIVPALKANNLPVTRETKLAFVVGCEISQKLSGELLDQFLMDLGYDPARLTALKAMSNRTRGF